MTPWSAERSVHGHMYGGWYHGGCACAPRVGGRTAAVELSITKRALVAADVKGHHHPVSLPELLDLQKCFPRGLCAQSGDLSIQNMARCLRWAWCAAQQRISHSKAFHFWGLHITYIILYDSYKLYDIRSLTSGPTSSTMPMLSCPKMSCTIRGMPVVGLRQSSGPRATACGVRSESQKRSDPWQGSHAPPSSCPACILHKGGDQSRRCRQMSFTITSSCKEGELHWLARLKGLRFPVNCMLTPKRRQSSTCRLPHGL